MASLDLLAKRYGKMPHELLDLDFVDFIYDLRSSEAGMQLENELHESAMRKSR